MEEFKGFLEAVQLGLGDDYAQVLWDKRIRSARVLAAAEPDDLVCHGIDKAVARAIIKQAKDVADGTGVGSSSAELLQVIREEANLTRMSMLNMYDAQLVVAASTCNTATWSRISLKLDSEFGLSLCEQSPCCLGALEDCAPQYSMVWNPPSNENAKANVERMVEHLERQICPPGTRVWPVQNEGWLTASIDCGPSGKFSIMSSKTDYLVMTTEAWDRLAELGTPVTGDHLADLLQSIIAFYEAKTTKTLKDNPGAAKRQGVLELLAGDKMRNCQDHLVLLVGDGNIHYGVHFSENPGEPGRLHVIVPPPLPRVSEGSVSSPLQPRIDMGTLPAARALLARALSKTQARLRSQGAMFGHPPEGMPQGSSGSAPPPPGSGAYPRQPSSASPGGTNRPPWRPVGGTERRTEQCSPSSPAQSGPPQVSLATQEESSEEADSWEDEHVREAWQEQVSAQTFLQVLRMPDMSTDLGLPSAPTAFMPLTMHDYAKALRFMVPDGCGGWNAPPALQSAICAQEE